MKISFEEISKEKILIFLMSIFPIVDSVNGFILRSSSEISLGIVYKFLLCVILSFFVICRKKINKHSVCIILAVVVYVMCTVCINTLLPNSMGLKIDKLIKFIFNIVFFFLLMQCCKMNILTAESFYKILNYSAWVIGACYLIPYILEIGYHTYSSSSMGYKAFFYSQNEIGVVLNILFYFSLYKLAKKINLLNIFQVAIIFLCCILLNTKSTVIASLFGIVIWTFEVIQRKSLLYKIVSIGVILVGILLFKGSIVNATNQIIVRMNYLAKNYQDTFFAVALSGRNYELSRAWNYLQSKHTVFRFLFGNGFCSNYFVEMDLVDIFFYLGIIGTTSVACTLISIFKRSQKNFKQDKTHIRSFSYLILILIMNFAGHVLFMATAGCYFVLYCCFLLTFNDCHFVNLQKSKVRE